MYRFATKQKQNEINNQQKKYFRYGYLSACNSILIRYILKFYKSSILINSFHNHCHARVRTSRVNLNIFVFVFA